MTEQMKLRGTLSGHGGWVTQIATTPEVPDMVLSASRDKTIIVWQLTRDDQQYGYAKRALTGHSHFVSDVVISSDGMFALSGSWDKTLRLWDITTYASPARPLLAPLRLLSHLYCMSLSAALLVVCFAHPFESGGSSSTPPGPAAVQDARAADAAWGPVVAP